MHTVILVIQIIMSAILIATVLLQSGKNAGLSGAIAGVADSFMSRGKATTWDAKLARATKWIAAAFLVCTLLLSLVPTGTTAA